jgi:hypothetical protein
MGRCGCVLGAKEQDLSKLGLCHAALDGLPSLSGMPGIDTAQGHVFKVKP